MAFLTTMFLSFWRNLEISSKIIKNTHVQNIRNVNIYNTYEQLNICVIEFEAGMNSRSIIPLFSDSNDVNALTSAHFPIGDSLMNILGYERKEVPDNRLSL